MEAGADGEMFISSISTGDGDFIHALDTTNSGVIYYPRAVLQSTTAKVKPAQILIDPLIRKRVRGDSMHYSGNEECRDRRFIACFC